MSGQESGDIFDYKLGKWIFGIDECAFMNLSDIGKDKSMRQYLIESVENWANKKEALLTDEFILEMCDFIKNENEDLYYRLMNKCALKGISAGEGIFEALGLLTCGMIEAQRCREVKDEQLCKEARDDLSKM